MSPAAERRSPTRGLAALVIAHAALTGLSIFVVWVSGIRSDGCGSRCDYSLFYFTSVTYFWFAIALLASAIAGMLILSRLERACRWPLVAGILLTIGGAAAALMIGGVALAP